MNFRLGAVALLMLVFSPLLDAESIMLYNLKEGKLVPKSESPDGKYLLLEVFHSEMTENSVVIAKRDRSAYLAFVPMATVYGTDKPFEGRATVLWNEKSSLVATHDSLGKNSKLALFQVIGDKAEPLPLPDLLKAACSKLGLARDTVASSGQIPTRWESAETLNVTVRITTKAGRKLSHSIRLGIDPKGGAKILAQAD